MFFTAFSDKRLLQTSSIKMDLPHRCHRTLSAPLSFQQTDKGMVPDRTKRRKQGRTPNPRQFLLHAKKEDSTIGPPLSLKIKYVFIIIIIIDS
jgi:hypothetical protein